MEYAISQNVKAINLSPSGYAMNDSAAIDQAIHDAVSAGILVVGAAGNNGRDASLFVPGRCMDAYIIGSCDEDGKRLSSSNYGDMIDYFVTSGSTSEAAAKFTGKLVKTGFVVDDAVKSGGVFSCDGGNLGTAEEKTKENINKDVTVYAQWTINTTRLHLDPEGGVNHTDGARIEGNPDYLNLMYDWTSYYVQALPTKTGYTFEGYYTEKNGTGSKVYGSGIDPDYHPNDATIYMIATPGTGYWKLTKTTECIWQYAGSTLTVYAHWLPNAYTVAFDGNGSTGGTMTDESMTYDTAKALPVNTFTRKGYTFSGWNTKADGSGTSYADKASVKNLAESGTVTLYAQWTANTYTVTIPTAITYSNMPTGNVDVTNTYDVSVDCKTGSFGDIIEVASTPSPMVSKSGKSSSLAVSSGSSKLPLSFTAAGTKQDQATITGTANTADVWTGAIQYTVTKK